MPRRYDSADAKRRVLAACVRLFLEKGYTSTTVTEIAKEADVSVGSFQNVFHTKDGAYTYPTTVAIIHQRTSAELQAAFSAYLPGAALSDFFEMELGTAGMMRGFMAKKCDPYFTLERKVQRFLGMSLSIFQVPPEEREKIIAYVAQVDIRATAKQVMDTLFKFLSMHFELKA